VTEAKVIAVVGATGAQGGGLVRAILANPSAGFAARAITRHPDSDGAKALADQGAEVVQADLDDEKSMIGAFTGAHGVFCVTNFWEHFSPAKETEQAGNAAQAAKAAGVAHVVWSTLEDTRKFVPLDDDRMPTLMGTYKVPHYDGKGEANALFTEAGVPTTFLQASFYWDNMIHFGMGPKRGEDGVLAITFPIADAKMPGMAASDVGLCAYGVFAAGDALIGKTVRIAGGLLTGAEMASSLSRALGEEVRYNAVSPAAYRGFGFPGAEDLGNMFQAIVEFPEPFGSPAELAASLALNPALQTFDDWLAVNVSRIPVD
jgi:uncharacterized protein YbjT (DUF2867 family)